MIQAQLSIWLAIGRVTERLQQGLQSERLLSGAAMSAGLLAVMLTEIGSLTQVMTTTACGPAHVLSGAQSHFAGLFIELHGAEMKPVKQTKLYGRDGIHNGNCFAACLASMLDIPLWMVPAFEDMFGRSTNYYLHRTEEWLEKFFKLELNYSEKHEIEKLPEFYIASGESPRGVKHSVIYSEGKLVHDPHFSDAGIIDVEWVWYFTPIAAA